VPSGTFFYFGRHSVLLKGRRLSEMTGGSPDTDALSTNGRHPILLAATHLAVFYRFRAATFPAFRAGN
jgi:hypothetical protein